MRGVAELRRGFWVVAGIILAGSLLAGCKTVEGGPDRLYSVTEERAQARNVLETSADGIQGLVDRYYGVNPKDPTADAQRLYFRNEIIARRMYIIDVEYSEYEESLTNERQKVGFFTTATAAALGIAATLTTPVRSAQIVAGTGAAVLAGRAAYDSEVVVAKTIQIAQGQMRALRDQKATIIQSKIGISPAIYPLSAALHDLEDYYRAGTLTAGLLKATGDAGTSAQIAAISKDSIFSGTFARNDAGDVVQNYIAPGGKLNTARVRVLNGLLVEMGYNLDVRTLVDTAEAAPILALLVPFAASKGIDLRK
jgi:hypothetical protein